MKAITKQQKMFDKFMKQSTSRFQSEVRGVRQNECNVQQPKRGTDDELVCKLVVTVEGDWAEVEETFIPYGSFKNAEYDPVKGCWWIKDSDGLQVKVRFL